MAADGQPMPVDVTATGTPSSLPTQVFVLAVVGNQLRLVKIGSDQIGAEGVTRQQHIAADIPLS